jgi:hypothetical protein
MWSCYEALDFGRRPIHLTVVRLGWNPKATAPKLMDRLLNFRRTSLPVETDPPPVEPGPRPTPAIAETARPAGAAAGATEPGVGSDARPAVQPAAAPIPDRNEPV